MTCSSTYHGPCTDPVTVNISFCCPCILTAGDVR